jgi:hypothetical protein
MADGVVLNSGSGGATAATDDCGAAGHAQVIKLAISTDGSATLIPAEANNGLDVDVTRVQGTVTVQSNAANLATEASLSALAGDVGDTADAAATAGSVGTLHAKQRLMTSQLDSIKTAVETLDNAISGSEMQVDIVSSAAIPVTDNGGSLTVDGTVAVTNAGLTALNGAIAGTEVQVDVLTMPTTTVQATNLDIRDLAAASDSVTIHGDVGAVDQLDLTNSNPVTVAIVDGDGTQITSFGGGTQYTEGATDATITGTAMLWEDTGDTLVTVNASKPLPVAIISGAGSGGTAAADDADFTAGTTSGTPAMGVYESTPTSITDGDLGTVGITVDRRLKTSAVVTGTVAVTQSGTWDEIGINDSGNSITVDNATLSVVGGGTEATALRVTIASDSTGVLSIDDNGGTITVDGTVTANLAAGTNNIGDVDILTIAAGDNNIGNVDIVTMPNVTLAAGTNTNEVVGDAAHDAAAAGNPLSIGATAETALSGITLVADGDATRLYAGVDGVLITRPHCNLEDIVSGVDTDTAGDSTAVIAAAGAGIKIYVTSVIVKNTHASTDAYIDLRDGAAGSVKATIPAPAAGGAIVNFDVPLPFTANTAVCVDPSAAVTSIITTVIGFKSKV